jgi:ribonuclease HI
MPFYAVANGKTIGVFLNWNDCKESVNGHKSAVFKKFDTREQAEEFISLHRPLTPKAEAPPPVDSDAGFVPDYYVYTDGACSNNGRPNAVAGIGIFFGIGDPRNISQKIEGKQTNNVAELTAILRTYSIIENDIQNGKKITIVTDSEYCMKCVSTYGEKEWKAGWKKDIPNKELVKLVYEGCKDKSNMRFLHIMAHTGKSDIHSFGNEQADKLANMAIGLESCPYAKA